ncbi:hypothetical protein PQX77_001328 [Marasmius sp. AFHP31]|nr:hypothetical protein PQX77_001328 [Marasmius sp. AFHP31]
MSLPLPAHNNSSLNNATTTTPLSSLNSVSTLSVATETDTESVYHGRQQYDPTCYSPLPMDSEMDAEHGEDDLSPELNTESQVHGESLDGSFSLIMDELRIVRELIRDAIIKPVASSGPSDDKSKNNARLIQLEEKDYPKVKYWHEYKYKEAEKAEKAASKNKSKGKGREKEKEKEKDGEGSKSKKGRGRRANNENVSYPFIETADGVPVDGVRLNAVSRDGRSFFRTAFKKGRITESGWNNIPPDVRADYYQIMGRLSPELTYCHANWKADRLGAKIFPGWWSVRHKNLGDGDGEEEDAEKKTEVKEEPLKMDEGKADGLREEDNKNGTDLATTGDGDGDGDGNGISPTNVMDPGVMPIDADSVDKDTMLNATTINDDTMGNPGDMGDTGVTVAGVGQQGSSTSSPKRPRSESRSSPSDIPNGDNDSPPPSKRAKSAEPTQELTRPKLTVVLFDEGPEPPLPDVFNDFDEVAMPVDDPGKIAVPSTGSTETEVNIPGADKVATTSELPLPTPIQTPVTSQSNTPTPSGSRKSKKVPKAKVSVAPKTSPGGRTILLKKIPPLKNPKATLNMKGVLNSPFTAAKAHYVKEFPTAQTQGAFYAWLEGISDDLWANFHDVAATDPEVKPVQIDRDVAMWRRFDNASASFQMSPIDHAG